jgi:hypothetical protein
MTRPLSLRSAQNRYRSLIVYCGLVPFFGLLLIQIQAPSSALCAGREVKPEAEVICPVQEDQQANQLEPGKPIERELAGGQSHSYQLTLDAGQYLHLVVE